MGLEGGGWEIIYLDGGIINDGMWKKYLDTICTNLKDMGMIAKHFSENGI